MDDKSLYDETGTYVEEYPVPFVGELSLLLIVAAKGLSQNLKSKGMETVSDERCIFQPIAPKTNTYALEDEQYVIAR